MEISTTECSEAPSATRKVAMEKTSAKYQPPQMPSGSVPNFGEWETGASRVSQILLILLIMCLKKPSRRFCFRHIIYKIYRIGGIVSRRDAGKMGRDPNGVMVFGQEMRYFAQLSLFGGNSDGWQKTSVNTPVQASRNSTGDLLRTYILL